MEDELLNLNNIYHSIIKYSPDLLWKIDANKRYVFFSENWEQLTGQAIERLIKENCIIGIRIPNDVGSYYKQLMFAYDNKQTFRIEYRLKNNRGKI